jgi:uncharacterized protein YnzC (UPF0291/DUF896 family)
MNPIPQQFSIIGDMLEPFAQALTPDIASQIVEIKASPEAQARISELAKKCNEGELTEAEQSEYEAFVRAGNLVSILKAKARNALSQDK